MYTDIVYIQSSQSSKKTCSTCSEWLNIFIQQGLTQRSFPLKTALKLLTAWQELSIRRAEKEAGSVFLRLILLVVAVQKPGDQRDACELQQRPKRDRKGDIRRLICLVGLRLHVLGRLSGLRQLGR